MKGTLTLKQLEKCYKKAKKFAKDNYTYIQPITCKKVAKRLKRESYDWAEINCECGKKYFIKGLKFEDSFIVRSK